MIIESRNNEVEVISVLKKIKVEGEVHERLEVIVHRTAAPLECEGFKSFMVLWAKLYEPV